MFLAGLVGFWVVERSAQGRRATGARVQAERDPGVPWSVRLGLMALISWNHVRSPRSSKTDERIQTRSDLRDSLNGLASHREHPSLAQFASQPIAALSRGTRA
jgi:hypothetical protein